MDFPIQDFLARLLGSYRIDAITEFCLTAILTVLVIYTIHQYLNPDQDSRSAGATTLTSLGIAGTFIGILLGLQEFNFTNVQQGITVLLEGLKTAFYTSVMGLGCAIAFQTLIAPLARSLGNRSAIKPSSEELTATDFYELLDEINNAQDSLAEPLDRISKAIGGDGDSSLLTQIKLSRHDFAEFRSDLKKDLEKFAEMLSKSATETIIEALNEVIRDFNNNLTEQFGENFKHLNEAVFELVEWQENYKQQLEQMQNRFEQTIATTESLSNSTTTVAENLSSVPKTMDVLREIIESLDFQIKDLGRHLEAFEEMKANAVRALPLITDRVSELVEQITDASKNVVETSQASVAEARNLINDHGKANTELVEQYRQAGLSGAKHIEDALVNVSETISNDLDTVKRSFTEMSQTLNDQSSELLDQYRDALATTQTAITEHHQTMDRLFAESVVKVQSSHNELLTQAHKTSENMLGMIEQVNKETSDRIRTSVDLTFSELDTKTRGYFGTLDESLREAASKHQSLLDGAMKDLAGVINAEVNEIVRQMGQGLKKISEALVADISSLKSLTDQILKDQEKGNR
jgi:methyl-accepting chemotaxis protein